MSKNKIPQITYRRKREQKTDYKKRLALLKSKTPRIVIRKFNKNLVAQIVAYSEEGDKVTSFAHSKELEKYGWKNSKTNLPAAYLLGVLLSKKSKTKEAILDTGLHTPTKGSRIFAFVKGCVDGGMKVPHSEEALPSAERLSGKHIQGKNFEKDIKEAKEKIIKG